MIRDPPVSTLFPYPTLSRPADEILDVRPVAQVRDVGENRHGEAPEEIQALGADDAQTEARALALPLAHEQQSLLEIGRATSELQSRLHLVCRLLLEKKKHQH